MLHGLRIQGATIFDLDDVSSTPSAEDTARSPWGGGWIYGGERQRFRFRVLDRNGQLLRMRDISTWNDCKPGTMWAEDEACPCDDVSYQSLVRPATAKYVGGHVHGYRIVCPVCNWYAQVNAATDYMIPEHARNCRGASIVVRSEFFAYPFERVNALDPKPVKWEVYNRWTGKYLIDERGAEHPNQDLAFPFSNEAAARQAATRQKMSPGWCHIWPCNAKGQYVDDMIIV